MMNNYRVEFEYCFDSRFKSRVVKSDYRIVQAQTSEKAVMSVKKNFNILYSSALFLLTSVNEID